MNKFGTKILPKLGLSHRHRILAEGGIPPLQYEFEREKWAMAERFGQYGLKSGVDIRQLWPSVEEVEEIKALRLYRKVSEAQKIAQNKIEYEERRRKNKLDRIEKKWLEHDKHLAEFMEEQTLAIEQQKTEDQQLDQKVQEVKEYFGYSVDPNDPRFELLFAEKEENLKLEAKMGKVTSKSKNPYAGRTDKSFFGDKNPKKLRQK